MQSETQTNLNPSSSAQNSTRTFANIKVEKSKPEELLKIQRDKVQEIIERISKEKGFFAAQLANLHKNEWLKPSARVLTFAGIGVFALHLFKSSKVEKILGVVIGALISLTGFLASSKVVPWAKNLLEKFEVDRSKKVDLDKDLCWSPGEYLKLQRSVKEFLRPTVETHGSTRGDLLVLAGDPGLGKTVIAKGIADLADRKIVQITLGGDKYISDVENKIIDGFKEAKRVNGVLFIDEADSLIRSRGAKTGSSWDHAISVITTAFLQNFDKYRTQGVKVILATNDPNDIDQAVLDRSILNPIARPDAELRKRILINKLEKLLTEENLAELKSQKDFDKRISEITEKFNLTGRSIESAVSRAKVIAEEQHDLHADQRDFPVSMKDLETSFEETSKNASETSKINLDKAKMPDLLSRLVSGKK
ncbi:MAG: ATP-binding protein [Candidatus Caenarcaniphilales bacterium]|jgi:hypothetical protein|nr:ATP-binding protein [Candidatus Caenarcaniphilales bacterium]